MFKKLCKQFLCLFMCLFLCLSPIINVYADDYVPEDTDDDSGATYYIIDGKDVSSLFDFGIADVKDLVSWVTNFKTYTVIKKYKEKVNGENKTVYKMYFNTPNLQSIVKNRVIKSVSDGYTDSTYNVNDTQWIVKVGDEADSETAITKYGFNIPSYTYMGEFPKLDMTMAGIVPTTWYNKVWTFVKSVFGCSFISAPDADNFNTITYLNHQYKNKDDYIISFFKKYYLKYFENKIPINKTKSDGKEYFTDPQQLIGLTITQDESDKANAYQEQNKEAIDKSLDRVNAWNLMSEDVQRYLDSNIKIDDKKPEDYLSTLERYQTYFTEWTNKSTVINKNTNPQTTEANLLFINAMLSNAGKDQITTLPSDATELSEIIKQVNTIADKKTYFVKISYTKDGETKYKTLKCKKAKKETYANMKILKVCDKDKNEICNYKIAKDFYENCSWMNVAASIGDDMVAYGRQFLGNPYVYGGTSLTNGTDCSGYTMGIHKHFNITIPRTAAAQKDAATPVSEAELQPGDLCFYKDKSGNIGHVTMFAGTNSSGQKIVIHASCPSEGIKESLFSYRTPCAFGRFYTTPKKEKKDGAFQWLRSDFVTEDDTVLLNNYAESESVTENYELFTELISHGKDPSSKTKMQEILYRQCMIENQGKDGECWSSKYGDGKTTLTIANIYAYSGLYEITEKYFDENHKLKKNSNGKYKTLSTTDANLILATLQSYCGPYYSEVLSNMMKLMCATANYDGNTNPLNTVQKDDYRVMPYDVDSLLSKDQENYACPDPRVEMYKEHIIGTVVSKFNLNGTVGIFIKPQKTLINIGGRITEISIFMQQLCNFDALENINDVLSPTNMWDNTLVTILMALLALFFIIKTVSAILKMGTGNGNIGRILISFLFLTLQLGFILAIASNPTSTWNSIKQVTSFVMNLGERATIYSNDSLSYLYGGSNEMEVTYYTPYLDLWSKYNTGYGLMDEEQLLNHNENEKNLELKGVKLPKINNKKVKHYSIMLIDSFNYYGDGESVISGTSTTYRNTTKIANGPTINNNAYRVVDHFLAPRVKIKKSESNSKNLTLNITENENYNGQFQGGNVLDLLVKLLNCCLMCFISLIKFMTFLWQWFVFYIFIYRVILSKGAENKTWTDILIETFAPCVCICFLGMYAGIAMFIGMDAEGLLGLVIEIFLFIFTFKMLKWWKELRRGTIFPRNLNWIYMITNLTSFKRKRNTTRMGDEAQRLAEDSGDTLTEEERFNFDERTNHYFNEDGTLKSQYKNDPRRKAELQNWYQFALNEEKNGKVFNAQQRNALNYYKANYEQDADDVESGKYNATSHNHNKQKDKNKDKEQTTKINNKKGDDTKDE